MPCTSRNPWQDGVDDLLGPRWLLTGMPQQQASSAGLRSMANKRSMEGFASISYLCGWSTGPMRLQQSKPCSGEPLLA